MTAVPLQPPRRLIEFSLDGQDTRVPEGSTILEACRAAGKDIPTLCEGDTLTPKNACRVCVVEVEGARTLAPACSRRAEPGMAVRTDTGRARHSRKTVLELLASATDLSTTPRAAEWIKEYGAEPGRFGAAAARLNEEPKVDNDLYVRDYDKCIQCYKCVDACGDQWQNTFAISVAGRGFDARISTEHDAPLTDSACVLRQLHRGVPDRGAQFQVGVRHARGRDLGRVGADGDDHGLRLLRGGLQRHPPCPGE